MPQIMTTILATTGTFLGLIGTVLGIISLIIQLNKNRAILKVTPMHSILGHRSTNVQDYICMKSTVNASGQGTINEDDYICIEVVNMSSFPVTVSEIGLLLKHSKERAVIAKPTIIDEKPFPRRLEARESFSAYAKVMGIDFNRLFLAKCAYAETDCGVVKKGNSPALKEIVNLAGMVVIQRLGRNP